MATPNSTGRSKDSWRAWDPWSKARLRWRLSARAEQITPAGDWLTWFLLGGRGSGKTRSGAEDLSDYCRRHDGARIALVAPTFADIRDTMVEGESGLLSVLPDSALHRGNRDDAWNRGYGELRLANGCLLKGYPAETPNRLRGPQHHRAWVDEPASFPDAAKGDVLDTAWNNLMLGLRLGRNPQVVVTGTPKPLALVRQILHGQTTVVSRMSTYDNLDNLAQSFRRQVLDRYEGTRTGRQELHAELLDDVEGALWHREWIETHRRRENIREGLVARTVVALDPAGGTAEGDEQAIVVACLGVDWRYYVLWSEGVRLSPDAWLRRAAELYHHYRADRVVYESNYGDKFLTALIRTTIPEVPTLAIHAKVGKRTRAEPISALYEQGRVSHVGVGIHDKLEDQLCSYSGAPGEPSPDRLDACVYALTDLNAGAGASPSVARRRHGEGSLTGDLTGPRAIGF